MDKIVLRPRFGPPAMAYIGLGLLCLFFGLAIFAIAIAESMLDFVLGSIAGILALLGAGLASPLLLIGKTGQLRLDANGLRIVHPALLRHPWEAPAAGIHYVRYAPPDLHGWSMGLDQKHDTIEIRFCDPRPKAPARWRYMIFSGIPAIRNASFMPVPGIRVDALTVRVELTDADRRYVDLLDLPKS